LAQAKVTDKEIGKADLEAAIEAMDAE